MKKKYSYQVLIQKYTKLKEKIEIIPELKREIIKLKKENKKLNETIIQNETLNNKKQRKIKLLLKEAIEEINK